MYEKSRKSHRKIEIYEKDATVQKWNFYKLQSVTMNNNV